MTMMEHYIEVMNRRFACKLYEPTLLTQRELTLILEAARLSPTSFGLEGWEFHVIQNPTLKEELTKACFDQESVATAPVTIALVALKAHFYAPEGEFVKQRASRFPTTIQEFIDDYRGYYDYVVETNRIEGWSRSQCYIAAANMMSVAAGGNIQSCAIEGFDEDSILNLLNLSSSDYTVALLITFGHPAEPERVKIREKLENLVHYH